MDTLYILELSFLKITIIVTPCKGIRIPESGKFWLVESWILEKFVVESGILGYVIQLKESGIPGFKSRIQDYVGFPYMMQLLQIQKRNHPQPPDGFRPFFYLWRHRI